MKAIFFSTDKQLFAQNSDAIDRMLAYAGLLDELFIIVFCNAKGEKHLGKITLYPTGHNIKAMNFFKGALLGWILAKRQKVRVVVAQDPLFTGLCGWLAAKAAGAKLVTSAYGINVFDKYWQTAVWKNRILRYLGKFIFFQSDAIQADGYEIKEDLKKRYGEKVFWKPMIPRNIEDFKVVSRKTCPGEFKLLFIGRMVRQKNIPMLIEVIDRLTARNYAKKISFTVIGDGPEKKFFDSEIIKRGLRSKVRAVHGCSRREITELFSNHDALITTAFFEGFPRVFMEAAAAGLPIVTTRVGGVANALKDGESGYVLEQGDLEGFIARLEKLIDDRNLAELFSKRIKADFWQNYSFETTVETQKKIFDYLEGER